MIIELQELPLLKGRYVKFRDDEQDCGVYLTEAAMEKLYQKLKDVLGYADWSGEGYK